MTDRLNHEWYRFNFFQAIRLLEWAAAQDVDSDRPRKPLGEDYPPGQEVVRLRALAAHTFPAGEIASFQQAPDDNQSDAPPEMVVSFMGLTGPAGVLPQHYTQLLLDRIRHKDYALRDYLDLFHHRLVSLFYRAWRKYRFFIQYEQARQTGRQDLFTQCLFSLVGLGTAGLRDRQEVLDDAWLYYGGHFAHFPRSAVALEQILVDYFGIEAEVMPFTGQWLYLSREDQSSLPRAGQYEGLNNRLGSDVVVGQRVWGVENKFRLRLGPISYRRFCNFFPGGDALVPLCQLVRSYVGPDLDFDVQPLLRADQVPACRLGGADQPTRLGWNSWLRNLPYPHDAEDAVFCHQGGPTR